jgi:hypothetical protein
LLTTRFGIFALAFTVPRPKVVPERQAVLGRERIRGDEQRRAGVGARSAHQNV